MMKKRFIRDKELDKLIDEFESLLIYMHDMNTQSSFQFEYINSVLVIFKTTKKAMINIESTIEMLSADCAPKEMIIPLIEACNHLKSGLISLYESFFNNVFASESFQPEETDNKPFNLSCCLN